MKGLNILSALLVALGLLAGCGGGGGSTASSDTVSGIASMGAAMTGTVSLKDTKGTEVTAPIGAAGAFSVAVDGLTAPFLLRATADNKTSLYSYADNSGTANINPLTNLAVMTASGTTDMASLYQHNFTSSVAEIQQKMPAVVNAINTQVSTSLAAYGVSTVDCLKGPIEIGKGIDAVFDSMKVNVDTNSATVTVGSRTQPFISVVPVATGGLNISVNSANLPTTIAGLTSTNVTPTTGGSSGTVTIMTPPVVTPPVVTPSIVIQPIVPTPNNTSPLITVTTVTVPTLSASSSSIVPVTIKPVTEK